MARADWEEVKRLAADFQRAQLSTSAQKLSERNCIEIVTKLAELKLLDVTFTSDGKEYVTPQHIVKEIRDELYVHGGRVNLVDLSQTLKIDLSQIEARANELIKTEKHLHLILGQLISKDYLDGLGEEVNEILQSKGQLQIGELAKNTDLPGDFLQKQIEKRLGSIIKGQKDASDPRVIYNEGFLAQKQSWMKGVLSAITKPTPLGPVLGRCKIPERLFFSIIDGLIRSKRIAGNVSGGQHSNQAIFIPALHSKSQNEWVESFYVQNGYLEYDNLVRLGITDPKGFIKRKYPNEELTFLPSGCVGNVLMEQIDAAVGEALAMGSWLDVTPILPSVFDTKDANQLLQESLKRRKDKQWSQNAQIFCNTTVVSDYLLQTLKKIFDPEMQTKAEKDVTSGAYMKTKMDNKASGKGKPDQEIDVKKDRKEERRKKATGGKGGGGTQGRETKTRSTKKKTRGRAVEDSDSDFDETSAALSGVSAKSGELDFLSLEEIQQRLRRQESLREAPEELLQELASHFWLPLRKAYQQTVRAAFEATLASASQSRRKTHSGLQDKLASMVLNVRNFEKGLKQFQNSEVQQNLAKHLLKTVCTDVTNDIFEYLAQENMLQFADDKELTAEVRAKLLARLPEEMQEHLQKLHKSLSGKSVEDFLNSLEVVLSPSVCDMVIKKADKKKEKQAVTAHRQGLIEQLAVTLEPALTLHLSVIILFQTFTQCILHASGKFVPQILLFLHSHLVPEVYDLLHTYQGLVIKQLTITDDDDDDEVLKDVKMQLEELTPKVKEVAISTKKSALKLDLKFIDGEGVFTILEYKIGELT